MDLKPYLAEAVDAIRHWEATWGPFQNHEALQVDESVLKDAFDDFARRLEGNYPFFHPRYAGQMLKPPHPVAVIGYLAAMLINPNNHALDGGPPTSEMEKEVIRELSAMFGFPDEALGHLTTSGTIANLEAVWVARESHPGKAIAVSDQAHYTHERLGRLLRMETMEIPSNADGRIRLDALEETVRSGKVGTIVLTAGTTALGAVDPIADVVGWRDRYGVRIHVDGAYGGFFALVARSDDTAMAEETRRHFLAIAECDSVAVDPHKHGLQPYGCGCILFRDPEVGRVYKHESPFTYFTSEELHLGEISFECSRAGAAAAALWLTLRMFPLESGDGLGPIVKAGMRAAHQWHTRMQDTTEVRPYVRPELDILTYFPTADVSSGSAVDAASRAVFETAMNDPKDPLFVSLVSIRGEHLGELHPDITSAGSQPRILRSVLMKPEHEYAVDDLHNRLMDAVRRS